MQVVSAKSVKLRQIAQETVETGFMCGTTRGLKDQFCEDAATLLRRAEGTSIRNVDGRYYTNPGASICDLPASDVASIGKAVDIKDMFDSQVLISTQK